MLVTLLDRLGSAILDIITETGDFVTVSGRSFLSIFKRPFDGAPLLTSCRRWG